jgi:lipopolysaccharide/colanic/teichoic acid biosynthesis glycosyltransferase
MQALEVEQERAPVHATDGVTLPVATREARIAKRAVDLVGSLVLLVFVLLVGPLIMLAIKLDSRGPTVFRQYRVGRGGRRIPMYKFRTMYTDAEQRLRDNPDLYRKWVESDFKLPAAEDPRITRVGRVLRKTSLDELPQVLNVLAGHMSLVGPRPIEPEQVDHLYGDRAWVYLSSTPGLTGLWQVSGRSSITGEQRVDLDQQYVEHWSLGLDLRILARTVPAVFEAEGAH